MKKESFFGVGFFFFGGGGCFLGFFIYLETGVNPLAVMKSGYIFTYILGLSPY